MLMIIVIYFATIVRLKAILKITALLKVISNQVQLRIKVNIRVLKLCSSPLTAKHALFHKMYSLKMHFYKLRDLMLVYILNLPKILVTIPVIFVTPYYHLYNKIKLKGKSYYLTPNYLLKWLKRVLQWNNNHLLKTYYLHVKLSNKC